MTSAEDIRKQLLPVTTTYTERMREVVQNGLSIISEASGAVQETFEGATGAGHVAAVEIEGLFDAQIDALQSVELHQRYIEQTIKAYLGAAGIDGFEAK